MGETLSTPAVLQQCYFRASLRLIAVEVLEFGP